MVFTISIVVGSYFSTVEQSCKSFLSTNHFQYRYVENWSGDLDDFMWMLIEIRCMKHTIIHWSYLLDAAATAVCKTTCTVWVAIKLGFLLPVCSWTNPFQNFKKLTSLLPAHMIVCKTPAAYLPTLSQGINPKWQHSCDQTTPTAISLALWKLR